MGYAVEVPGYEILGVLGRGGQAAVYHARQRSVAGREVAVKAYDRALTTDRDQRRFQREVRAVASLSGHRHVIQVYDAGLLPSGQPYLAMELCPGGSLAARLRQWGPVPAGEVRAVGVKIAGALATAHAAGVLHRDVKPGNVLLTRDGEPVLTDFGIAALLRPDAEQSATMGLLTPAYAAPELFHGVGSTVAGDVYSLGATLYALLVGRPPRWPAGREPSLAEMFLLYGQPLPDVPGAPPALLAVLRRAMASDPAHRHPSAAHLAHALAEVRVEAAPPANVHAAPPPADGRGYAAPSPLGPAPLSSSPPGPTASGRSAPGPAPGPAAGPGWRDRVHPGRRVTAVPTVRELLGDATVALALVAGLGAWGAGVRDGGAGMLLVAAALGMLALAAWGRFWPAVAAYATTLAIAFWTAGGTVWRQWDQPALWPVAWLIIALAIGFAAVLVYDVRARRRRSGQALRRPRWSGPPIDRPPLPALAHIPAARFFRLPSPHCEVAVAAGDRVALLHWTAWPARHYTVSGDRVHAGVHAWEQGSRELTELRAELARQREQTAAAGGTLRAFLVVRPDAAHGDRESGGVGPGNVGQPVIVDASRDKDATVLAEERAEAELGAFLAERPYELVAPLLDHLARLAEPGPVATARSPAS